MNHPAMKRVNRSSLTAAAILACTLTLPSVAQTVPAPTPITSTSPAGPTLMAGQTEPYTHLPSFYSDLFDLGYEAVGELDSRLQTVADWKEPFQEGVIYYLEGERVRGVLLWNTWGQVAAARELIAENVVHSSETLTGRISD